MEYHIKEAIKETNPYSDVFENFFYNKSSVRVRLNNMFNDLYILLIAYCFYL